MKDSSKSITRSALNFFSGTLISRMTGVGREIAMAICFGVSPQVAAFWMSFRFAYLLRRIFGEGALNTAFIPHFETLRTENPTKGFSFFYHLSSALTQLLLILILLVEGGLACWLLFGDPLPASREVIRLSMLMMPALLFISLYALNASFLNCERIYFLPSVAPTIVNLIWIGAVLFIGNGAFTRPLEVLAMVLVFAFAMQWLITCPMTYSLLFKTLNNEKVTKIPWREVTALLKPFLLGIIGVTAVQVNTAFDALFARFAELEGPAYLWYALRLQQLPLALFGVALASALLPPISRAIQEGNKERYQAFLQFALKRAMSWMIPATGATIACGFSSVALLYGHGQFSSESIDKTGQALLAYGLSLFPMTATLILGAAFYAKKDFRTPAFLALFSVGINCLINSYLVFFLGFGAISIAFSTFIVSVWNLLGLAYFLQKERIFPFKGLAPHSLKVIGCTLGAIISAYALSALWSLDLCTCSLIEQIGMLVLQGGIYLLTLLIGAYFFKIEDLLSPLKRFGMW